MKKRKLKKLEFQIGDVVEEVTVRRFKIARIGNYYGTPLYCANDTDCGRDAESLRLIQRAEKKGAKR